MRSLAPLAAAAAMVIATFAAAEAVPIVSFGQPVTGIGSSTGAVPNCPSLEGQSCYDVATGAVTFFIPLTTSRSGVFGVTDVGNGRTAGTVADTGGGTENSDALTMYLRFSPVAPEPLSLATLRFDFVDLDLAGGNDPRNFFESIRFYDADGTPLTQRITMLGQTPGAGDLPFTVTGNGSTQSIVFSDIRSVVENPFYIDLRFRSSYDSTGTNTPESMIATLTTDTRPVPEPSTLGLLGAGLIVLGAVLRPVLERARRAPDDPPSA